MFEASLFQRTTYTGVIVNNREFITTETVTTTCEGEAADCAALGAFLAGPFGADPLATTPQMLVQRQVLISPRANE